MVIRLIMYVMKLNKVTECISEYQDLVFRQLKLLRWWYTKIISIIRAVHF